MSWGKLGHELGALAAERAGDEWRGEAMQALRDHAEQHDKFTVEDVRMTSAVPPAPDQRAWGGIVKEAHRAGLIAPAGWVRAQSKTVHGMVVTLWESRVRRG